MREKSRTMEEKEVGTPFSVMMSRLSKAEGLIEAMDDGEVVTM